jgi:small-conductance mechanosensitive channel
MTGFIESLEISSSPYVNAILSVIIFIVIAKIADMLVDKVLRKFTRFTKSDLDDKLIDLVHKPILFTVIILGVIFAVSYLKPSQKVIFYTNSILYSLLAVIWCFILIKISASVIEHAIQRTSDETGMKNDVIPLIENVSKIVFIALALMLILSIWKINITPLMASAGIAGAAVAFAAKDTIANVFAGISVSMDKPFKIGDYIVLDKGERGEVVAIGLRSTRIKTRDDIMITIPNSIIANTKIINESAPIPKFRIRIPIGVAYGSDIDLIQKTLFVIAEENENVLSDPVPSVRFRDFGNSSLNFELLFWTKEPALRGLTIHELNCAIYKKFNELSIKIPFPQRDVHIHGTS